jgi:hypothetical protein
MCQIKLWHLFFLVVWDMWCYVFWKLYFNSILICVRPNKKRLLDFFIEPFLLILLLNFSLPIVYLPFTRERCCSLLFMKRKLSSNTLSFCSYLPLQQRSLKSCLQGCLRSKVWGFTWKIWLFQVDVRCVCDVHAELTVTLPLYSQ